MPLLKTYFDCSTSSRSRTSRYFTPGDHSRSYTLSTLLQHHRDALEPVGELRRNGRQLDATRLLKVRELRDLEPVEQNLPSDAPRAEGGRLPVVLFEADVVLPRVDAARFEAVEIELLHLVGRRLEDHLKLVVLEEPVRVLTEAAVGGTAGRLHVRHVPVRRTQHAKKGLRMHGAGADLDVERLLQRAPARRPELRQLENQALKSRHAPVRTRLIAAFLSARAPT